MSAEYSVFPSTPQEAVKLLLTAAFWIILVQVLTTVLKRANAGIKIASLVDHLLPAPPLKNLPPGETLAIKLGYYNNKSGEKSGEFGAEDKRKVIKKFKEYYKCVRENCHAESKLSLTSSLSEVKPLHSCQYQRWILDFEREGAAPSLSKS